MKKKSSAKGNSVKYLIKEGFRNIRANRLMSLASVGVLTACLILVGFTILLTQNIDHMVGFIERQNEVVVFLKMDATQDQIDEMKKDFENEENVEKVTYISKEQALSDYMDSLADKTLAENIGDELFLPASLRISIKDLSLLAKALSVIFFWKTPSAYLFVIFPSLKI